MAMDTVTDIMMTMESDVACAFDTFVFNSTSLT